MRIKGFRATSPALAYEAGVEGTYTVRQGDAAFTITASIRFAGPLNAAWAARLERLQHDIAAIREAGAADPAAERALTVQAFADTLLSGFSWDLTDEADVPHPCTAETFVAVMCIDEFYLGAFVPMSRDAADRARFYEAVEAADTGN